MHARQARQAATIWSTKHTHPIVTNILQAYQRRSLSELYSQSIKNKQVKDTRQDARSPLDNITDLPRPKIQISKADPLVGLKYSANREDKPPKNAEQTAEEYIEGLHRSNWNSEETWVRFNRLPSNAIAHLRNIDLNYTLAKIRGSEKTGSRSTPTSATLNRMLAIYEAFTKSGMAPDKYTYQELIAVNVELLNFKYAYEWLDKMVKQNIVPTIRPYRTILKGYSMIPGEIDNARQLWHEIKSKVSNGRIATEGSKIDLSTYTCYIAAEAKAGNFARVVDILQEMDQLNVKPDITLRNTILEGLVKHRGFDAGKQEATLIEESGYELNGFSYVVLLNAAIQEKRADEISKLLVAAASKNIIPPSHIIDAISLDAMEVLQIMDAVEGEHKVRLYNTLIEAAMRGNDFSNVLHLIGHMRQNKVKANLITYTLLFDALNKAGRLDQAKSMFSKIFKSNSLKPDAHIYSIMIDACGRHGDIRSMVWFKTEMQKQGLHITEPIYNSILSALARWRQSNIQAVMMVVNELEHAKPAIKPTSRTFSAIFAAFAIQAKQRKLGSIELQFLQRWYRYAHERYFIEKDSYFYYISISAFVQSRCLTDAMTAFKDMIDGFKSNRHVAASFVKKPVQVLELIKLSVELQEYGAALEVWNRWFELRLAPMPKATELALFACDQMGQPDIARNIANGLLQNSAATNIAFCPQMVSESVLALYIAIMIKHERLKEVMLLVQLWTDVTKADAAMASNPLYQISETTVSRITGILRQCKHPEAPRLAGELLSFIDKHYPEATPE
ncbi:hypothetical protein LPJ68_001773 [Coemansia sp. RSA 1086]|nr:hypothetical protein LPJ68_001773 [Coemansia sp. RSA 1086]